MELVLFNLKHENCVVHLFVFFTSSRFSGSIRRRVVGRALMMESPCASETSVYYRICNETVLC
jgi:hypothetical protein